MPSPLEQIIEDARSKGEYRCAHCNYPLGEVPMRDDLSIICPECGYEMAFEVKVRLRARDLEFDRDIRGRLGRIERLLVVLGIILIASVVGIGIIALAIIGF
ncbi:MAG: hypothetical protein ACF8MF_01455 [Phycisphaerales bacterium JB052]